MQKKGGKSKHHHHQKAATKKVGKSERCEALSAAAAASSLPQPQQPRRGSWCAALGIPAAFCVFLSLVLLVPSIATRPDLEGNSLFDLSFIMSYTPEAGLRSEP